MTLAGRMYVLDTERVYFVRAGRDRRNLRRAQRLSLRGDTGPFDLRQAPLRRQPLFIGVDRARRSEPLQTEERFICGWRLQVVSDARGIVRSYSSCRSHDPTLRTLHIWTNTSAPVTYLAALFVGGPHSRGSSSLDERSILLSWLATVGGLRAKGAGSEYDALQLKTCDGR